MGKLNADEFLESLTDTGTATVNAGELRTLLQNYRTVIRDYNKLKGNYELLQLRNVSLRQQIVETEMSRLEVYGIDITV